MRSSVVSTRPAVGRGARFSSTGGRVSKPAAKPTPKPAAQRPAAKPARTSAPTARSAGASPRSASRLARAARPTPGSKHTSVPAQPRPAAASGAGGNPLARVLGVLAAPFKLLATPLRALGRLVSGKIAVIIVALVAVLAIGGVVVVNAPIFAATDIVVNGTAHVPQETAERLVDVPDGSTLLNVDVSAIEDSLKQNPWVSGVEVERSFPHTLTITPVERTVEAICYISADDVAWAVGDDACWIAPVSLAVTVDAAGNVVGDASGDVDAGAAAGTDAGDGATAAGEGTDAADPAAASGTSAAADGAATGDGTTQLTGVAAARMIARAAGAVLFTDVPADVSPSSGTEVTSEVVLAGLAYAHGFSDAFVAQIQSIALSSVDAITCYLDSGVEIALGEPEDIETKERIVTQLLAQEQGVTYINVRTPDAYTFRATPAS